MKKILFWAIFALALPIACRQSVPEAWQKKDNTKKTGHDLNKKGHAILPEGHPDIKKMKKEMTGKMNMGAIHHNKIVKKIDITDEIKKRYPEAIIEVKDLSNNKSKEYKVDVGKEISVGKDYRLILKYILPDFKMDEKRIYSGSLDPRNPAAMVEIVEGKKTIFNGWIFKKYPNVHNFKGAKIALRLIDLVGSKNAKK